MTQTITNMDDLPMPKLKKLLHTHFDALVKLYDEERARAGRGFMMACIEEKKDTFDVSYIPESFIKEKHTHAKRLLANSTNEDLNDYMYILGVEDKKVVTLKLKRTKPSKELKQ